jgi:hypothetical protein
VVRHLGQDLAGGGVIVGQHQLTRLGQHLLGDVHVGRFDVFQHQGLEFPGGALVLEPLDGGLLDGGLGVPVPGHAPVDQGDQAVDARSHVHVVGDDHDRGVDFLLHGAQGIQHGGAGGGIQVAFGSSARSRGGSFARARAMATRCCWPPESWLGRWPSRSPSPSRARISLARLRGS